MIIPLKAVLPLKATFVPQFLFLFTGATIVRFYANQGVLKCDVLKMKVLKLWDLSGYSKRTMSKRPTYQK